MNGRTSTAAFVLILHICVVQLSTRQAEAQITLDRAWLEAQVGQHDVAHFDVGDLEENPLTAEHEELINDIIENRVGPDQTYDFSGLPFELRNEFSAEVTHDVGSLPGSDDAAFSSANFGMVSPFREEFEGEQIAGTASGFFELTDGALLQLGSFVETDDGSFTITFSPADSLYALPLTDGTAWTGTSVQSVSGFSLQVLSSAEVEGYGTLILPGGIETDALRIKRTRESSLVEPIVNVEISYELQTREGHVATIEQSQILGGPEPTLTDVSYSRYAESTAIDRPDQMPDGFVLEQNYPNPFNPRTTIPFELTIPTSISVRIFDVAGREVAKLIDQTLPSGRHEITWNAGERPSGVYYYTLEAGDASRTRALILHR